jgi:hypothetical protein
LYPGFPNPEENYQREPPRLPDGVPRFFLPFNLIDARRLEIQLSNLAILHDILYRKPFVLRGIL